MAGTLYFVGGGGEKVIIFQSHGCSILRLKQMYIFSMMFLLIFNV